MKRPNSKRAPGDEARREAAELIKLVAPQSFPGETIKARILRASNTLGWSLNRTEDVWRGDAQRIESHEMDQLRGLPGAT